MRRISPAMTDSAEVNMTSRHQPVMPHLKKLVQNREKNFIVFIRDIMDMRKKRIRGKNSQEIGFAAKKDTGFY